MKIVAQRVSSAHVSVEGHTTGAIGLGLLLLVGIGQEDTEEDILWLSHKIVNLRIFDDDMGLMNKSILEIGGDILAVNQFTLLASLKKGNRPAWHVAAKPPIARPLFECFVKTVSEVLGRPVQTGIFGADMQVSLTNTGPVTLILDSKQRH